MGQAKLPKVDEAVPMPASASQRRIVAATNSGPLSE
jgi:hypothetical protein